MLAHNGPGIVGTSFGLINADLEVAATHFVRWENQIATRWGLKFNARRLSLNFEELIKTFEPLRTPMTKRALIGIDQSWTLYLDNDSRGGDPVGAVAVLSKQIGVRTVRITSSQHTMRAREIPKSLRRYGANILEVYDESGSTERSICCANDGGKWVFEQFGNPYDFEDLESYSVARVDRRFGADLLQKYLAQLTKKAWDPDELFNRRLEAMLVERL